MPDTVEGRVVTILLIISGVMYMAMPLSIIGSNFTMVWGDRDVFLVLEKTRQRMSSWGYAPDGVLGAFLRCSHPLHTYHITCRASRIAHHAPCTLEGAVL